MRAEFERLAGVGDLGAFTAAAREILDPGVRQRMFLLRAARSRSPSCGRGRPSDPR
jgi:hypothetical protein